MMGKWLGSIFRFMLLGCGCVMAEAPAISIISWQGSAYADGDAFNVTATIGEKEADLVWEGFAGQEFDFMDDKEKPRVRKEFVIKDEPTLKALRIIADQVGQCDAGFSGVIGQGVSVEATVESPRGKIRESLHYFATPSYKTKAGYFERIPWAAKELLVKPEVGKEIPRENKLSQGLRIFAGHLEAYEIAFESLSKASKAGGDLPLAELGKVWAPLSLEDYLKMEGKIAGDPKVIKESLPVFKAILEACLAPPYRALLCGEGAGGGGVILSIDKFHGAEWVSFPLLEMKVEMSDCPVRLLPHEAKAFLLHFLAGFRSFKGQELGDICQLVFSDERKLSISQIGGSFPRDPGFLSRLEYLNGKDLCSALLGPDAPPEKRVAIVTIPTISLHPQKPDRAKIDFWLGAEERVMEVNLTDGKWTPGKVWSKQAYYLIDGVFHNDADFRPEGR